jgi:hypothetical protein
MTARTFMKNITLPNVDKRVVTILIFCRQQKERTKLTPGKNGQCMRASSVIASWISGREEAVAVDASAACRTS